MWTRQRKKPSRLTRELEEMGRALHRLGALSVMPKACFQHDEYAKITMRDLALDKIDLAGPPSPREIVATVKARA